jgi:hypothetical protein
MKKTLTATAALAALLVASPATAGSVTSRTVVKGPVRCHTTMCVQYKHVTIYTHGELPATLTLRRTAPTESRTPTSVRAWTNWKVL